MTRLSSAELHKIFPDTLDAGSAGSYVDWRKGVIILDRGDVRVVRMKGSCPNLQNGNCKLEGKCLLKSTVQNE